MGDGELDLGEARGSKGAECETGNGGRWFVVSEPVEEDCSDAVSSCAMKRLYERVRAGARH